ncbi:hypothetical protein [Phenylobacterium soli]|uniref:Glycosyl transferase n=1 Tax=Phenylobacterium soli TaxID=2170551 RepID=A0A328ABU2_9CAUL|nr:hypothetical protein [Phenylobacterium soli]RAK51947.1 hypothetical protein DJ017_19245 [Phenylobacterium soli]
MDVIFTIVSRNYAAQAATLMQSLAAAEPDARRVVVATDGPMPQLEPLAEVIPAAEVCPPFAAMSVYYDALELNTAVKPFAFQCFLGEADSVTYLDPDIYVFRPLAAVREALGEAELALTPHLTRPLMGEAMPDDRAILRSGVYNLGFMAARASPKTRALVEWWGERCRFDCRVDFAEGLFTDQRWMDLAPGFVDSLAILRTPTLNLAYWNLEGRTLAKSQDGWTVDGEPLGFFHFSGFDPARPDVLSKHQDRIAVAAGSPLAGLLADYGARLLANGHAAARQTPYAHDRFASGAPVTSAMRRRALAAARAGEDFGAGLTDAVEARLSDDGARPRRDADAGQLGEAPPAQGLIAWLRGVSPDGRPRALSALLAARADLRARFGEDPEGLLAWALGVEAPAGRFAPDLLPADFAAKVHPDLLHRAARFADPDASELKQRLSAAFGLAARGRWPEVMTRALRADWLATANGRPAPFPRLFEAIWQSRTDLQRQFPLRTALERFRFHRWLAAGGLAEHGVEPEQLAGVPLLQLARLTVGGAPPRAAPPARAAELWVVGQPDEAREIAADRLVYEAQSGRFLGPQASAPGEVGLVRFLTPAALAPADAMALHARGVRWARDEVAGA